MYCHRLSHLSVNHKICCDLQPWPMVWTFRFSKFELGSVFRKWKTDSLIGFRTPLMDRQTTDRQLNVLLGWSRSCEGVQ